MSNSSFSPDALHIPDGFLTVPVAIVGWVLAVLVIGVAIRQTRDQLGERQVPMMGMLAAFIFAAQAVNFPIAGGTSGHLLGGALAAIIMGPWAGSLIMTAVITIQGLLFQDGGLLVMGWNLLNMGVFTAFTGYAVYAALRRMLGIQPRARLIAVFIASWFSVEVGAVATAFELAASGTSPIQFGLPAMMAVHALIGVGEGLITMGAVSLLLRARPEVLSEGETAPGRGWANVVSAGLLLAVVVGSLAPFASASPDGLERVAQDQGFMVLSEGSGGGIFADYALPWIEDQHLATILAVIGGTIIIFGLVLLLARGIVRPWGSKE